MKSSLRTITLIAAIGMTINCLYYLAVRIFGYISFYGMGMYGPWPDLMHIVPLIYFGSIALLGFAFYASRSRLQLTPAVRIYIIVLACLWLIALVAAPFFHNHQLEFYCKYYAFRPLLTLGVWLLYAFFDRLIAIPSEKQISAQSIGALILACCSTIFVVLDLICGGMLTAQMDITTPVFRMIAALVFVTLNIYAVYVLVRMTIARIPAIRQLYETRNVICLPQSFNERSYPYTRKATLVLSAMIVLCLICALWEKMFHYWMTNETYLMAWWIVFGSLVVLSWLLISYVAWSQLSVSKGYWIFNIVCQLVSVGGMIAGLVMRWMGANEDDIPMLFGLLAFLIFMTVHTYRVIHYQIPKN